VTIFKLLVDKLGHVTPNLWVTKEIMYQGPQVADMEFQEPDG